MFVANQSIMVHRVHPAACIYIFVLFTTLLIPGLAITLALTNVLPTNVMQTEIYKGLCLGIGSDFVL